MPQRTGGYRDLVIIQKVTEACDAAGQPIRTWSEFAERWVGRRILSGTEQFEAGVVRQSGLVAEFRTHLTRGVSEKMRILYPGDVAKLTATATGVTLAATGTAVTVDSADGFPLEGRYRVRLADELMEVTAGQGTTSWTVTRALDGTAAATAHATGTAVQLMQPYDIERADVDWQRGAETVMLGRLADGVA